MSVPSQAQIVGPFPGRPVTVSWPSRFTGRRQEVGGNTTLSQVVAVLDTVRREGRTCRIMVDGIPATLWMIKHNLV